MRQPANHFQGKFEPKAFIGLHIATLLAIVTFTYNWIKFGIIDLEVPAFFLFVGLCCFYVVWGYRLSVSNGQILYRGPFELQRALEPLDVQFFTEHGGLIDKSKFKTMTIRVKSKANKFKDFCIPANLYTKASIDEFLKICQQIGVELKQRN